MLSRLVITFLLRSKRLNFMAAVTICGDFGVQKIKSDTVSTVSFLRPSHTACGILVSQPSLEPGTPALTTEPPGKSLKNLKYDTNEPIHEKSRTQRTAWWLPRGRDLGEG